jgi:hypothetical protein
VKLVVLGVGEAVECTGDAVLKAVGGHGDPSVSAQSDGTGTSGGRLVFTGGAWQSGSDYTHMQPMKGMIGEKEDSITMLLVAVC